MSNAAATNRLIHEKSPYLLQHAQNPVDWYPWGPEAFEKAKRENKPILVSIGYSTCHWCHVMERESYEDPETAAVMNRYLVNIKVDREERPDVDKIYITAVSAMTGSGGWPLNVFLTPDLKPFFGGTYFPPLARWGHPGWRDVVKHIGQAWENPEERKKMIGTGDQITVALQSYAAQKGEPEEGSPEWLTNGFKSLQGTYDASHGGFSEAPKFPMPVYQQFLLRYYVRSGEKSALEMTVHTLREMAQGGIYDHLGGGFARYSTDADWRVPHFEKMLYDNAQLAVNYTEAYQVTKDEDFQRVAGETLTYIRRDMTHPDGGFYSAEDADSFPEPGPNPGVEPGSEKKEGAFYVWERSDILKRLGDKDGEIFCFRYGVRDPGNAPEDPHGEFKNKNILYVAHPIPEIARHFTMAEEAIRQSLAKSREKLFQARAQRPRPHLDDKVISGWNGLMISAFAKAYQVFGNAQDLAAAEKAAAFLKTHLYDSQNRLLYRRWREGERKIPGIADDYAFVVQGLIDLYEADFDPQWLAWAEELTEAQNKRFLDVEHGGYFMTAADHDPSLLLRVKEDMDNVEPSASSVAALNLLRLSQYLDRRDYEDTARKTLRFFGGALKETPRAFPAMLCALNVALTEPRQIVIAGKKGEPGTETFLKTLRRHFQPAQTVMLADGGPLETYLIPKLPFLEGMKPIGGKTTAYVCVYHVCKQPTTDVKVFEALLGR